MADITLEDMDFGFDSPEPGKSAIAIGDFVVLRDFDGLPYTTGYVVGNVIDQEAWLMKVARAADDGLRVHPGEIFSVDHIQSHLVHQVNGVVPEELAAESTFDVNINGQSSVIVPNAPKAQIISSLMRMDDRERLPIEYPGSDRMALPIVIMTNADYYQERTRDLGDGLTRRVIPSKEISGVLDFVNEAGFVLDTADGRIYLSTGREIGEEDMAWLKSVEERHGEVTFQAEDAGVRILDLETGRSIFQSGPEPLHEQLMDEVILYRDEGVFGGSRTTNTVSGLVFAVHNKSSIEMISEDGKHFLVHGPRPMTKEQEESLKQAAQDGARVKIDYSESLWGEVGRVNDLQASRDGVDNVNLVLTHRKDLSPTDEQALSVDGERMEVTRFIPVSEVRGTLLNFSQSAYQLDTKEYGPVWVETGFRIGEDDDPTVQFARDAMNDRTDVIVSVSEDGLVTTLEDANVKGRGYSTSHIVPARPLALMDEVVFLNVQRNQDRRIQGTLVEVYDTNQVEILDESGKHLYVSGTGSADRRIEHWQPLRGRTVRVDRDTQGTMEVFPPLSRKDPETEYVVVNERWYGRRLTADRTQFIGSEGLLPMDPPNRNDFITLTRGVDAVRPATMEDLEMLRGRLADVTSTAYRLDAPLNTAAVRWLEDAIHGLPEGTDKVALGNDLQNRADSYSWASKRDVDFVLAVGKELETGIAPPEPLLTSVPMNLVPFLGDRQGEATEQLLRRGEEREFYSDKMRELSAIVQAMPETYGTDGMSDAERPVSLRYFGPGDQQWFIIEKDRGDPANNDFGQTQAFGLADLGMGEPEMGYISIEEITSVGAELDYHFTPTTLLEIKKEYYPELVRDAGPALDADLVAHLETRNRVRQGELGPNGLPFSGGVDSFPGSGLPTGLGGDRVENAEGFLRNHAMRNPEQAAQWVESLRSNPDQYAQAAGLQEDNIRLIAAQMEGGVNRMRLLQVGDLVRFEPHDKDPLYGEPYSGRVIDALDTSGGDVRYHLRAETGPDRDTEATVYGRNGTFRMIDLEQAYGFDRNAPERLSPQQKAIQEYTNFYETLPDRVNEVVVWAKDTFGNLHPYDFDGYGKAAKALHEKVDNAFGVIREGESRGDIAPDKALREAFAGNGEGIENLKEWGKAEGIRVTQSSEINGLYDSIRENFKERLKEHGNALVKANDFKSPQEMVLATYWKHGIEAGPDSPMVGKLVAAVENKDLKTMLPWVGHNSQNPATQEAFTRLTGVALGKTQKERVAQLEAWAGPERVEALHKEQSELAKAKAEEAPRKDVRRAFDALYGMSVQVSANSAETLDGQKWLESKVAEGYTHVISRKRGAAVSRSLKNPETEFITSIKDSRFQTYCKSILALEPSGDIAKAMEAAKIPLDLPKKSEDLQKELVSVDVHGRDGTRYVVSLVEGKDDTLLTKLQAGEKSAVAELQQVHTADTSIPYLGARMELDGKSVGVRISNGGNGALNIDVMSRKEMGMSAWEKLNVDPSRVPANRIEGPSGDWVKTMLKIEDKSRQKAQGYQRSTNQELNLGI